MHDLNLVFLMGWVPDTATNSDTGDYSDTYSDASSDSGSAPLDVLA